MKSLFKACFYSLTLVAMTSCGVKKDLNKIETAPSQDSTSNASSDLGGVSSKDWVTAFNSNTDNLSNFYSSRAILVFEDGQIYEGDSISIGLSHFKNSISNISKIEKEQQVIAGNAKDYLYEIVKYKVDNGSVYQNLSIWKLEDHDRKKEMEFVSISQGDEIIPEVINRRREEWIRLCNQHNAQNLVENLYSEDAIYYNHKPVIRGHRGIVEDYAYMNNEQYSLKLSPLIMEKVNDAVVYEIGQCSGTYGGKYILIWKKDGDGKWHIFLDSNI